MDKKTLQGIVLIAVILIGSNFLFKYLYPEKEKSEDTQKTEQVDNSKEETSKVENQPEVSKDVNKEASPITSSDVSYDSTNVWSKFLTGIDTTYVLENENLRVEISSKGAKVKKVELRNYSSYADNPENREPLYLREEGTANFGLIFPYGNDNINTEDLYFSKAKTLEVNNNTLTLGLDFGGGKMFEVYYELPAEEYMLKSDYRLVNSRDMISKRATYLELNWNEKIKQHERDSSNFYNNSTIHYRMLDEKPDYLSETKEDAENLTFKTDWISFKEQFFARTLIANNVKFSGAKINTKDVTEAGYVKQMNASLTLPLSKNASQNFDFSQYFGPLHYKTLRSYDLSLERQIPLGWSLFITSFVNRFIIIPVFNVLSGLTGNFGIIILLLTFFIKIILLFFTYKSYLSTAKMKLLKPEIDKIKERHQGDAQRIQQEQMKLYKISGVSPFGGCLPLIFQIPFLIAMFRFFPASIELRQEAFLWSSDLSTYDSVLTLPFRIPGYGSHVSLFTLLMTISTLIYTRMNNSISAQQKELVWISYLMPIMFMGIFNNYASGLSLYYLYYNLLTFSQQYIFKKLVNESKLQNIIDNNLKNPNVKKSSGLMGRIEDMQKKQQAIQKQRQGGQQQQGQPGYLNREERRKRRK